MLGLIGIFVALVALVVLAMRGFNLIFISPILAIVVAVFNQMPITEALMGPYMAGFVGYASNYFLIFLLGSVFGKLMDDSRAARSIALAILRALGRYGQFGVIIATMMLTGVLTYGGLSLFVAIFAILPIARPLYKELDIPWPIFLGAFFAGMATFTMTMLPGTPAIQNIIPTRYLGTDLMAAPVIGIIGAILVIALNLWWLRFEMNKMKKKGLGFEETKGTLTDVPYTENEKIPPFILSLIPPVFLIVGLNVLKFSIVATLLLTCLLTFILFFMYLPNYMKTINEGAVNVAGPILNTCAVVGFGSVVGASEGFVYFKDMVLGIPGPPIISFIVVVNLLAGITGSASGGLTIAMETLSQHYIGLVNPELLHRFASIASGGLDAMPHNGAVITGLTVSGLSHKLGYKAIFVTCVVMPTIVTIVLLPIAAILYPGFM